MKGEKERNNKEQIIDVLTVKSSLYNSHKTVQEEHGGGGGLVEQTHGTFNHKLLHRRKSTASHMSL